MFRGAQLPERTFSPKRGNFPGNKSLWGTKCMCVSLCITQSWFQNGFMVYQPIRDVLAIFSLLLLQVLLLFYKCVCVFVLLPVGVKKLSASDNTAEQEHDKQHPPPDRARHRSGKGRSADSREKWVSKAGAVYSKGFITSVKVSLEL